MKQGLVFHNASLSTINPNFQRIWKSKNVNNHLMKGVFTKINNFFNIMSFRLDSFRLDAFVLSRIDYCNSLLFGSTHDVTSHLQRTQNYAARVIIHPPKSSNITTHLKSLHWFPVKVRSTYKIACLCYHCHSSTAPSYVA